MSKCAKIICTYFGNRRTHVYNNPKDMTSFFLKMMKNEVNIDMGIETVVILVNNDKFFRYPIDAPSGLSKGHIIPHCCECNL